MVITSYALLRRDEEFLAGLDLTYAILDEAQHIKNPMSATAASAKRLRARRRLALTGTPIENRLSEIWSIFDFVSPGLLGPLDRFEQRFSRPIEAGDYKTAQRLRATIHPFILRRTKQEVAKDLPEKIETDQICDLTGDQRTVYQQVLAEVRAQVLGEVERVGLAKSQLQILAGLTRLRQAACDPRLLGLPRDFTDEDSGKLVALRELVQNAIEGGHKVLVFSQFVMMLKIIEKAMKEDSVTYEYLDGSTKDRAERIDRFQGDPTVPVFLISLKAGGTGLNLTAADTVIHFDPWWNPAVEEQATDSRPPHRPEQGGDRLPARRRGDHRGEDPAPERQEARAGGQRPLRGPGRRQEAHQGRPRGAVLDRLTATDRMDGTTKGDISAALRHDQALGAGGLGAETTASYRCGP